MSRLHLVEPPVVPALPTGELVVTNVRRPGELHDVVAVDDATSGKFAAKAKASRISADVAATLLVETHLLVTELRHIGVAPKSPPEPVSSRHRLSAAEAGYLRSLMFRRGAASMQAARIALPVRLIPRITPAVIVAAAEDDLEQAIAWEIAALLEGRTIGELGLLDAVRSGSAG